MNPQSHWQRATLLFQQQRWDLAATELRAVLTAMPDHASAHALLALTLVHQDQIAEAETEAQQAIACDPQLPFAHQVMATVRLQQKQYEPAAAAIQEAIQLDPHEAALYSTLGQIRLQQKRWQDALQAAERGLEIAPEDTDCLNLRSIALVRLGRRAEASDTLDASLAHDPDNPYTHQARGFALLHGGDAKGALHHFQEALRRDPTLESSRSGLVEALKARNPLYRLILGWFLWLDRFSSGRQLQIVIGLWLAARFGSRALTDAGYETAGDIVGFSWLGFVLLTACSVPLFNLLLLLHPLGRHALERGARNDAIVLGVCVTAGLGVGLHAWLGDSVWSQAGWPFWLLLPLPVAGIALFHPGWGRRTMQAFCIAVVVAFVWWAFQFQTIIDSAMALDTDKTMAADVRDQRGAELVAEAKNTHRILGHLVTALVISSWFVLLAPKGRAQRRR